VYKILKTVLEGIETVTIQHRASKSYASILVGYGGALNDFVVAGKEILRGSIHREDMANGNRKLYAGVQMFPFVNRVDNGRYIMNKQVFQLPQNDSSGFPHALHGLIYNKPMEIKSMDEAKGKLVLFYHFKKNDNFYPFEFTIQVEYVLSQQSLEVSSVIINHGKEQAPVGYGWHPYLNITGTINECKLQLPASTLYLCDERLIPTGETAEQRNYLQPTLIGNLELNHCFKMPNGQVSYTTVIEDTDGSSIQLIQKGFPYTQYYIPPDRKSLAIEPQTSIPDALNNGIGLILLHPDEALHCSFTIIVQKN